MAPFVALGTGCILAGGLLSAVTAPVATEFASWTTAYLVLIAGVVQIVFGAGQALLTGGGVSGALMWSQFAAFALGNAGVIAGTGVRSPWLVSIGSALLVVALVLFLWGVRRPQTRHRIILYVYRIVAVIVAVSIPVGVLLSFLKSA